MRTSTPSSRPVKGATRSKASHTMATWKALGIPSWTDEASPWRSRISTNTALDLKPSSSISKALIQ